MDAFFSLSSSNPSSPSTSTSKGKPKTTRSNSITTATPQTKTQTGGLLPPAAIAGPSSPPPLPLPPPAVGVPVPMMTPAVQIKHPIHGMRSFPKARTSGSIFGGPSASASGSVSSSASASANTSTNSSASTSGSSSGSSSASKQQQEKEKQEIQALPTSKVATPAGPLSPPAVTKMSSPAAKTPSPAAATPSKATLPAVAEPLRVLEPNPIVESSTSTAPTIPPLMIAISGAPEAGRTTLSHLLTTIFPPNVSVIQIHQDDFLVRKSLLVPHENGEYDSDCPEAYDMVALERMLKYVLRNGRLPSRYMSMQAVKEDRGRALGLVDAEARGLVKEGVEIGWGDIMPVEARGMAVCVVDGGWLFQDRYLREMFDVRLFLRCSRYTSRERRFIRPEFKNPEKNYWWRTREYFERVAWGNYIDEYASLFERGDVEGWPKKGVCESLGIEMQTSVDVETIEHLEWAAIVIIGAAVAHKEEKSQWESVDAEEDDSLGWRKLAKNSGLVGSNGWLEKARQAVYDAL